jgi:hypothetical protein
MDDHIKAIEGLVVTSSTAWLIDAMMRMAIHMAHFHTLPAAEPT